MKINFNNFKVIRFLLTFIIVFCSFFTSKAQAPACTQTFLAGNFTVIINAGEVACVPEGSTYNGSLVIRAGAHAIICNRNYKGSLTIDPAWGPNPAGKLWDGPGQQYLGAFANNGSHDNTGSACGVVCPTVELSSFSNVCLTSASFTLSGGTPTGGTYSGPGVSSGIFNPSNAGVGTHTITYTDGVSGCGNTAQKTITVDPVSNGGTLSADATVCSGTNSGTLTLSGNVGTVTSWESSTDNWVSTNTISNSTTSLTYTDLTTTTKYRAVVKSGACSSANSPEVTITVNPASNGGTLSADTTVCSETNSGTLILTGNVGSITGWESSTDDWGSTNPISNSTTSLTYNNLTSTTKYRAVVKLGACSSGNSNEVTITVNSLSFVGGATAEPTVSINTIMPDIRHSTAGVTGIRSSSGLPGGVTASYSSNSITISGTPVNGGTFNYTIIPISKCVSTNATGTIKVIVVCTDTIFHSVYDTTTTVLYETDTTFITDTNYVVVNNYIDVYDTILVSINDTLVHNVYDTTAITFVDTNYVEINKYVDVYDSLIVDLTGLITAVNVPFSSNLQVKVYPNPASELLILEVLDAQVTSAYSFELININGQTVMTNGLLNSNTTTIDISSFSGGTYYLKFYNAQSKMVNQAPVVIRK